MRIFAPGYPRAAAMESRKWTPRNKDLRAGRAYRTTPTRAIDLGRERPQGQLRCQEYSAPQAIDRDRPPWWTADRAKRAIARCAGRRPRIQRDYQLESRLDLPRAAAVLRRR